MARPKRVYPKSLPKFNLLHTEKVKMISGVTMTALHLIKETVNYFISIESWAFCCSTFKKMKFDFKLNFDIPIITDEKSVSFLNQHAWHDWVDKELKNKKTDVIETIELLDRLFPEKKKIFFYELQSLIGAYCHGTFISYDDNGNVETPCDYELERRKYYTHKYEGSINDDVFDLPKNVQDLYQKYRDTDKLDDKEQTKAYKEYRNSYIEYLYANHDLTSVFIDICKNAIVCPYIYSDCCVKGSEYENAGDIYMVVTNDTVYFTDERHF